MVDNFKLRKVFEDKVVKIVVEPSLSLLHMIWQQHPSSEQYRQGYRQAIVLALEYNTKYWLTDARQVPYIRTVDQHWMYSKMRPLLKGGKLFKFAIILQLETLMMTDLEPVLELTDQRLNSERRLELEFFLDLDTAQFWLWD